MGNAEKYSEGVKKRMKNLRPPLKKGERLEGAGRPKGSRNIETVIREVLFMKFNLSESVREYDKKLTNQEAMVRAMVRRAIVRGGHDMQTVIERVDGKVADNLNLNQGKDRVDLSKYTREEIEQMAMIEMARAKREHGKK